MSPRPLSPGPDGSSASVMLRIVAYGPASAGKTSTLRALGDGMGQDVVTPREDESGQTIYFDWMEYLGGRHNGKPILTRVATVPGHDRIRRLILLRQADVVLFVADSTVDGISESTEHYREMQRELAPIEPRPGVVVQANKRDDPSAVTMEEFRRQFELTEDDVVVETIATSGEGVRQAFVYAVRSGLERVGADVDGAESVDADVDFTPDQLLRQLEDVPRAERPARPAEPPAPAADFRVPSFVADQPVAAPVKEPVVAAVHEVAVREAAVREAVVHKADVAPPVEPEVERRPPVPTHTQPSPQPPLSPAVAQLITEKRQPPPPTADQLVAIDRRATDGPWWRRFLGDRSGSSR